MKSTFDRITAAFKQDYCGLVRDEVETPLSNPVGEQGKREFQFSIEGLEHGEIEAEWLAVKFKEKFGSSCEVAFNIQTDFDEVHYASFLLVSKDPLDTWALHLDASVPDDADFPASADFHLMESNDAIQDCIRKETRKDLQARVKDMIGDVDEYIDNNPTKATAFLDELISQKPAFLKEWIAHFQSGALEQTTPKVESTHKPKRM